ncbi:hypothetical protein AJ79_09825 [Helicocarpus griseus UAMH5409]|uniref:FAD-binding PCMH-type domain-containing protein n=1 Tax=Helicocarpus griseus UAMH5409 TaxID=1447875 RepID=A0A2B7WH08_9EURO|nr:hypothetical protein AJ79_09825 [Helicocarpus griseus UAMH5409]
MKSLVILAAGLHFATGIPLDTTGGHEHPTPSSSFSFSIPPSLSPTLSPTPGPSPTPNPGESPAGCRLLNTDAEWPAPDAWLAAFPGVVPGNDTEAANRPDYILAAMDVETVQAAVKFAADNNIRLTVVSSGHDFLGRNDAPSGLGLDISGLTGVKVLESFTPSESGAESPSGDVNVIEPVPGQQAAVTFGAGMSTQALNDAIDSSKLFTIGAAHGSVRTAGGYGQAGGHSPFSSKYGLGSDQVLEYKVVTADGELVVANSVSNPDLFWALRGGGGGTFGIVVEATVKAFPTPSVTVSNWWINATNADNPGQGYWDAAAYLHSQFPVINEQGVQGYYYVYPNAMKGIFLTADEQAGQEAAQAIWTPILEKLAEFDGMEPAETKYTDFSSYKEFYTAILGGGHGGCGHQHKRAIAKRHDGHGATPMGIIPMDSRLLGKEHLESQDLAQALQDAMPQVEQGQLRGHLIGGGAVLSSTEDTAVLPAWRQTYVHLIGTGVGDFKVDSLRKLAPDTGAYVNEASHENPNWKTDFWGSNYERLSEIKTKYDPNGVFWVTPGINADEYSIIDGRLCNTASTDPDFAPPGDNKNPGTSSPDNETGSPFPGTEPDDGNCTSPTPELPADFYDEPDLDPSKPGKDGATVTKIKYGPYTLEAMDMISNRPDLNMETPCKDCYITAIQANLEYEDGTTANVNTGAWLHHMVLYKNGRDAEDLVCNFGGIGLMPQRIYASGNERSVSRLNQVLQYGIELGSSDRIGMIYDLMNESDQPATYYLTLTYEWLPSSTSGYKAAEMAWLDITDCGVSAVPAQQGQFELRSDGWKSTVNGRLLSASGHVHNGGVNTTIWLNGEPICTSRQVYGRTPEFIAPPHGGHGGDEGDDGGHEHGAEGKPSISDAETCVDFGDVKVGDELVVSAYYDTDKYPLDEAHDGEGFESIMGISRVYIGT